MYNSRWHALKKGRLAHYTRGENNKTQYCIGIKKTRKRYLLDHKGYGTVSTLMKIAG